MKKIKQYLLLFFLLAITSGTTALAETAAEPLLVNGPSCPPGSPRTSSWILFEDQDRDGSYDFITFGTCDGKVVGRQWNPSIAPTPEVEPGDIIIGVFPIGTVSTSRFLTTTLEATGVYSWRLKEYDGNSNLVCTAERRADGWYGTSCPSIGESIE